MEQYIGGPESLILSCSCYTHDCHVLTYRDFNEVIDDPVRYDDFVLRSPWLKVLPTEFLQDWSDTAGLAVVIIHTAGLAVVIVQIPILQCWILLQGLSAVEAITMKKKSGLHSEARTTVNH